MTIKKRLDRLESIGGGGAFGGLMVSMSPSEIKVLNEGTEAQKREIVQRHGIPASQVDYGRIIAPLIGTDKVWIPGIPASGAQFIRMGTREIFF